MIINEILAIVWFVMCCLGLSNLIPAVPRHSKRIPESFKSAYWLVMIVASVLLLVGIAASVLLLFGATWARWLIGLVALADVIGRTLEFAVRLPPKIFGKISLGVSVITLVIVIGWATNIFHF